MTMVALTAAISKLHPPKCSLTEPSTCIGPTPWQLSFLLLGLGFMAIGGGGIQPCNMPFGAEQFNPTDSDHLDSYFNWFFFAGSFPVLLTSVFIVYIQSNVSWAVGLSVPACFMLLGCVLFFSGTKLYVKIKPNPDENGIASAAQVLVAAARKRKLKLSGDPAQSLFSYTRSISVNSRLPRTSQLRFLDKAAIITRDDQIGADGSAGDRRRLCTVQQVEETKCVMRVIPLWTAGIIHFLIQALQPTFAVLQALQSDRRLGNTGFQIPAASYMFFYLLTITLWIPIYDRILVPRLRKLTGRQGGITLLQKMGIGMVLAVIQTLISGQIEGKRRYTALIKPIGVAPKGGAISSMSAFWFAPQLAVAGLADAFNATAQNEFYYRELPENMRSVAGSFYCVGAALSGYLSGFLISMVHRITSRSSGGDWLPDDLNEGKLENLYYLAAGLGALNLGYFLVLAKWYRYKGAVVDSEAEEEAYLLVR